MNRISRFRIPIIVAALLVLAHPCDAQAGFEWIGFWKVDTKVIGTGSATFVDSGFDRPDGVYHIEGKIQSQLGFSQPWGTPYYVHPPYDVVASSSIMLSRHFRLSGSPGGWDVDMDWNVAESGRFWAHVSTSGPFSTMSVDEMSDHREPVNPKYYATSHKVHLPDGDYSFTLGATGSLHFDRPPWGWTEPFSVYYGSFSYRFSSSLKATAVPEPASWLSIGQGIFAVAGVMVVSKRRSSASTFEPRTRTESSRDSNHQS